MILGLPIRQCAEEVEVSVKTSFYMRHRILDVINLYLKKDIVDGIVEVDEVFIRESYKGNHSKSTTFKMSREPRKRGKGKFDGKLGENVTFVVDSHKSYIWIKKDLNIELKQVPRGKSMLDSVYLQHINSLHSGFKRWITTFNGVSSKYISNYLAWFNFIQLSKKNKKSDRVKDMLINVATKDTYITRTTIKNRFIELT